MTTGQISEYLSGIPPERPQGSIANHPEKYQIPPRGREKSQRDQVFLVTANSGCQCGLGRPSVFKGLGLLQLWPNFKFFVLFNGYF